jgi:hypothetical protein
VRRGPLYSVRTRSAQLPAQGRVPTKGSVPTSSAHFVVRFRGSVERSRESVQASCLESFDVCSFVAKETGHVKQRAPAFVI